MLEALTSPTIFSGVTRDRLASLIPGELFTPSFGFFRARSIVCLCGDWPSQTRSICGYGRAEVWYVPPDDWRRLPSPSRRGRAPLKDAAQEPEEADCGKECREQDTCHARGEEEAEHARG